MGHPWPKSVAGIHAGQGGGEEPSWSEYGGVICPGRRVRRAARGHAPRRARRPCRRLGAPSGPGRPPPPAVHTGSGGWPGPPGSGRTFGRVSEGLSTEDNRATMQGKAARIQSTERRERERERTEENRGKAAASRRLREEQGGRTSAFGSGIEHGMTRREGEEMTRERIGCARPGKTPNSA